jgi:hypothetical protein
MTHRWSLRYHTGLRSSPHTYWRRGMWRRKGITPTLMPCVPVVQAGGRNPRYRRWAAGFLRIHHGAQTHTSRYVRPYSAGMIVLRFLADVTLDPVAACMGRG